MHLAHVGMAAVGDGAQQVALGEDADDGASLDDDGGADVALAKRPRGLAKRRRRLDREHIAAGHEVTQGDTPLPGDPTRSGRPQAHLEQQLGVERVGDPHQRVELRRPSAPLEAGDRGLGRAAQDRELLLRHAPPETVLGDHPADLHEPLLVVAAERLRALAQALAHALERLGREPPAIGVGWLAMRAWYRARAIAARAAGRPADATRPGGAPSVASMRRVAITGLGAVTPVGNDLRSTWDALVAGRSGVDVIRSFDATDFPVNIAAEVKDFDPSKAMPAKEVRRTWNDVHFAVSAALEAAADAELVIDKPSRTGVVIGSVMGGLPYTLQQQRILEERGWDRVSPHWLPNTLVDTSTSHVATLLGARGINYSTESACATGTHADRRGGGGDRPRTRPTSCWPARPSRRWCRSSSRASARCVRSSTAATTRRGPRGPSTPPAPAS